MHACVCMCVCCVGGCVSACVRACVRACESESLGVFAYCPAVCRGRVQLVAVLGVGALCYADLPLAMTVQSVVFVAFNKVCTAQVRAEGGAAGCSAAQYCLLMVSYDPPCAVLSLVPLPSAPRSAELAREHAGSVAPSYPHLVRDGGTRMCVCVCATRW